MDNNFNFDGFDSAEKSNEEADRQNNFQKPDTEYRFSHDQIIQGHEDETFSSDLNQPIEVPYYQPPVTQAQNTTSTQYTNLYSAPDPKPKKEKKRFSFVALTACTLCAAIIGGSVSAIVVSNMSAANQGSSSQSSTNQTTTINVESQSSTLVEAVAEKVTPSVVGIRATSSSQNYSFFFGNSESSSEGSGVIYSSDGYIVTNYHVISSALSNGKIEVFLPSDSENAITATVIGYDSSSDLAVIKIDSRNLPAIELADSDDVSVGEITVAVGNPGGLDFMGSVSVGYISGVDRTLQVDTSYMTLIQTDAAINPGNSGGALVNSEGKLIGIPSVKISATGFEGMGFAIPSNTVVDICNNIISNKDNSNANQKPTIGVKISTSYDANTLKQIGYPSGALVADVTEGGPADTAGIKSGDLITKFAGSEIDGYSALAASISKQKVGDTVKIVVYRNGKYYETDLTISASNG